MKEFTQELSLNYYQQKHPEITEERIWKEKNLTKDNLKQELERLKETSLTQQGKMPHIESIMHKLNQPFPIQPFPIPQQPQLMQQKKNLQETKKPLLRRFFPRVMPIRRTLLPIQPQRQIPQLQPQKFQFQPTYQQEQIELGKLNPLTADNEITKIECQGAGMPILVTKASKINQTNIILTQQDIDNIIQEFSEKAKIPLISGVFRAAAGNLAISAIISEFTGSKFIIFRKTPYALIS